MSDDIQHCAVIDLAEEVYSKLRVKEIPPEFEPTTHNLFHLLANIRHQFTNYDELLNEYGEVGRRGATGLGILCLKHTDVGGTCTYDGSGHGPWEGCPTLFEIYMELKCRATELAEKAYDIWLESQREE